MSSLAYLLADSPDLGGTWPIVALLAGGLVGLWIGTRARKPSQSHAARDLPESFEAEELDALRRAYPGERFRLSSDGTIRERETYPRASGEPHRPVGIGRRFQSILASEYRGAFDDLLASADAANEVETFHYELGDSGPARHFEGRLVPQSDGSFLLLSRDVTAQRLEKEERAELEKRLRQLLKVEALGQLAGGVAHDFNNILTVITGHAQLIRNQVDSDRAVLEDLSQIELATEGAATLTRQLLAFSRGQELESEWLEINPILERMQHMIDRLMRDDIELRLDLQEELWNIHGDEASLEQVFVNLALNAADAMKSGGTFTIRTRNVQLEEPDLEEAPDLDPGRFICVEISDTGEGMTAEVRQRAFEPFFTTKSLGRGTGLGLASVYGVVHKSGGFIRLESRVGRGTTFKIFLPATDERLRELELQAFQPSLRGRETILLCDDDPAVVRVMRGSLEQSGYQVLVAQDANETLDIEGNFDDPLHLLVTDVVMAGMSGGELTEILRERRPGLRVLFVSGYPNDVVEQHCTITEDDGYLPKPFTPRELLEHVRQVLDHGSARIWT